MQSPLISAEQLLHLLSDKNVIIVDASSGKRKQDHAQYIQGAILVDLDLHMAAIPEDPSLGGRHPLPAGHDFSKCLGDLGITPAHQVIIYDEQSGANAAARFWWMLTAVGHQEVYVLDGGLKAAIKQNLPLTHVPQVLASAQPYPFSQWQLPLVTIKDVEKTLADKSGLVIDVRDAARYRGEVEPIDLVAGHIPGAINVPFKENLNPNSGKFLSPEALKQKYAEIFQKYSASEVVVHCGSGVTACHTLLAIALAGFEMPNLYVGSWSEWSRVHKSNSSSE
jgi:thiosulfate/3-mercaptopyruvate sulfurtransferase